MKEIPILPHLQPLAKSSPPLLLLCLRLLHLHLRLLHICLLQHRFRIRLLRHLLVRLARHPAAASLHLVTPLADPTSASHLTLQTLILIALRGIS